MLNNHKGSRVKEMERPVLWDYNINHRGERIHRRTPFRQIEIAAVASILAYIIARALAVVDAVTFFVSVLILFGTAYALALAWRLYYAKKAHQRLFGFIHSIENETHPMISVMKSDRVKLSFVDLAAHYQMLFKSAMWYYAGQHRGGEMKAEANRVLYNSFLPRVKKFWTIKANKSGTFSDHEYVDALVFILQWVNINCDNRSFESTESFTSDVVDLLSGPECGLPLVASSEDKGNFFMTSVAGRYYASELWRNSFEVPSFRSMFASKLSDEDLDNLALASQDSYWLNATQCKKEKNRNAQKPSGTTTTL